jgi:hypothetical protein
MTGAGVAATAAVVGRTTTTLEATSNAASTISGLRTRLQRRPVVIVVDAG